MFFPEPETELDAYEHLMLTPDSAALLNMATDLAIPVVLANGLEAVTPRAIGESAGVSRQAVHQWFGSRAELQAAVAARYTARWTRWCDVRHHFGGLPALLPDCEQVLGWTKVWLAIVEGATRDARLAELVAHARQGERDLVASSVIHSSAPERATGLLHALVEGLRAQLAAGAPSSTWPEAAHVLERTREAVLAEGCDRLLA